MHGPVSAAWLLVAVSAVSAGYCLLRMRASAGARRHAAGAEAVMGLGTAAMAVPASVLPLGRPAWLAYTVVFGAAALHAAWSAHGDRQHLHHLVGASAMVYMAAVMAARPGAHSGGHASAGVAPVTAVLLVYFAVYVLWSGTRLVPAGSPAPRAPAPAFVERPELARVCRLSMALGMFAMLLTL
ncbi:DUF5134 domain-containing protein [Streptomyces sp. NA04227]|uniref:DUF5134 domain-containing protein n=1 Tax=Streptomyces sp. NA04227 TaxID=2742136 RepID=UPI0020CA2CF0|nr:DUF5134 domain-containing protein [Streptomyces sp. NA04227]